MVGWFSRFLLGRCPQTTCKNRQLIHRPLFRLESNSGGKDVCFEIEAICITAWSVLWVFVVIGQGVARVLQPPPPLSWPPVNRSPGTVLTQDKLLTELSLLLLGRSSSKGWERQTDRQTDIDIIDNGEMSLDKDRQTVKQCDKIDDRQAVKQTMSRWRN